MPVHDGQAYQRLTHSVQRFDIKVCFVVAETTFKSGFDVAPGVTNAAKDKRFSTLPATDMYFHPLIWQYHVVLHSFRRECFRPHCIEYPLLHIGEYVHYGRCRMFINFPAPTKSFVNMTKTPAAWTNPIYSQPLHFMASAMRRTPTMYAAKRIST